LDALDNLGVIARELGEVVISGAAEVPSVKAPGSEVTTPALLGAAMEAALDSAGLESRDVDGLGVSAFALKPDHAIDLAWHLGLRPRWLMEDPLGGACMNMLVHAARAIQCGDAETILLMAGDRIVDEAFVDLAENYNRVTRDYLTPLEMGGPPAVFGMLTQRHMEKHGVGREVYGSVVVEQRARAGTNPGAIYRDPLSLEEYLAAPMVADPICLYDCVPVVAGADALILTTRDRAPDGVSVRALGAAFNFDDHEGEGLATGLAEIADPLWEEAGMGPEDVDIVSVYDDFPVMVLAQLEDLGYVPDGDLGRFVAERIVTRDLAFNTSGGMLTVGQAGPSGGLHGLVECVRQLRGERGDGQVAGARRAVVAGYGMVLYRYAAASVATVLESA
jgi:acetyl-CoA acetyltransferase